MFFKNIPRDAWQNVPKEDSKFQKFVEDIHLLSDI